MGRQRDIGDAPSITAMMRPSAIVRIAQCRCGSGRPSACSMVVDDMRRMRSEIRRRDDRIRD